MLLHKITKFLHEKDYFFLLLRFLSPSPPTPLLPVTVARADLLPPTTVTQAKTTQVKPQLQPTYRSPESAPRTVGIARTAASAARSACVVCLRSGIPSLRWTSSSSASLRGAPGGLTCAGTGPNGSGRRARTGAISFLFEHHFSALISFQTT